MKNGKDVKIRYRFCPRQTALETREAPRSTDEAETPSSTRLPETPPVAPSMRGGLETQMKRLGVTPETIVDFLQNVSAQELQNQLDYLDDRKPKERGAFFVRSVRESWTPPAAHTQLKASQNARKNARATKAKKQKKSQEEAAKRQEIAVDEANAIRLDALWDEMEDAARDDIEIETRDRLGVLFQEGKNSAALAAMRRQIQRESSNVK